VGAQPVTGVDDPPSMESSVNSLPCSLLKFVASAGLAARKAAKKRDVWGNHEHFEPLSNAASPSAAEFQQTASGEDP
jgi:hypothetical protein